MKSKIVYCYLVADILHIGHLIHLKKSKKQGDILIAGILTDKAVMEKKPKPIISYWERAETARAIKWIDKIVPQHTYSPLENVKRIKPDVLMESKSHDPKDIKNITEFVESYGGKVVVTPYYKLQSSTKIKNKIVYERSKT